MYKIEKLYNKNKEDIINLFVNSFKYDHYFIEMFPNKETHELELRKMIESFIEYFIENDGAYGILHNDELVSFILYLDYFKTRHDDIEMFNIIFNYNNLDTILYNTEIHDKVEKLKNDVMYIVLIAVKQEYRMQGIAGLMIDNMLYNYTKSYIVSDISNPKSIHMYEKRMFDVEEIDTDYYFVTHKPDIK